MNNFAYNARQYYDFCQTEGQEEETAELYFEHEHESLDDGDDEAEDLDGDDEVYGTPMASARTTTRRRDTIYNVAGNSPSSGMRRSMSLGDILVPSHHDNDDDDDDIDDLCDNFSQASVQSDQNRSNKIRALSRENLERLSRPKHQYSSHGTLNRHKFVSLAEAVNKFEVGTPQRFRTSKPLAQPQLIKHIVKTTMPKSPNLASKDRARRPMQVLTREEQEMREMEEAKKFKIKAHPVNKRIFQGPMKLPVDYEKKQPTIPHPFKLTAQPKKTTQVSASCEFLFHAKPVPKSLYVPCKPSPKKIPVTVPQTPNFSQRFRQHSVDQASARATPPPPPVQSNNRLTTTHPKPFSFEEREIRMAERKRAFINKFLEDEKKAREFHANPIPKSILRASSIDGSIYHRMNDVTRGSHKSEENLSIMSTTFKARPASVLHARPFEPKKPDRPLIEISDFQLNTDRRAKEREQFELKLREKEEVFSKMKQRQIEEQAQLEREEKARLRKEAEFKGQPVKKYKEVKIVAANKVTIPISPNWCTANHNSRLQNKENVN